MIRKNDMVQVITGKYKGKTGKVIAIFVDKGRALVEKLNVEKEASLHLSNLMAYCAKCGKGVRVGVKVEKDGAKKRVCRKCGESIGQ